MSEPLTDRRIDDLLGHARDGHTIHMQPSELESMATEVRRSRAASLTQEEREALSQLAVDVRANSLTFLGLRHTTALAVLDRLLAGGVK